MKRSLEVLVLYNEPTLAADDPDYASEAGVLESVEAVSAALAPRGYRLRKLGLTSPADLADALPELPSADVVFNLFEGFGGVGRGESEVTGLVELLGIPLTGSPAACLAVARDKERTKYLLQGAGLPTAPFAVVASDGSIDQIRMKKLLEAGPVIVKPSHEDGSLGIGPKSVVHDWPALARQIELVRDAYGTTLVEQFVIGREFNAAVFERDQPELLPLAEIDFCGPGEKGWQIVTYDAKWVSGGVEDRATPARCPAQVERATAERIGRAAIDAFRLLGCRDYARIDLRMDDEERLFLLEVNSNPDIGPSAGFARSLRAGGIDYGEFVERLVRNALRRGGASQPCSLST